MCTLAERGEASLLSSDSLDNRSMPLEPSGNFQHRGNIRNRLEQSHLGAHSGSSNQPHSGRWPFRPNSRPRETETARDLGRQPTTQMGVEQSKLKPLASNAPKAGSKHKSPASNKRLSFSEEVEEEGEDGMSSGFSLAESTRKRFQAERKQQFTAPSVQPQTEVAQALQPLPRQGEKILGPIICGAAQARGLRPYMEDRQTFISSYTPLSFASQPLPDDISRSFAAVYDGHNGPMAAEYANSRLHMLLARDPALRWGESTPGLAPGSLLCLDAAEREAKACQAVDKAIRDTFFTVDREILDKSRDENVRDGSTALVLLRMGHVLWTAHAGDSRAVLCREGKAVRLTEDHKPELEKEKARVEANGGYINFQRCWRVICPAQQNRKASGLAVSRSLGDLDFKEPQRFVECEPDVTRHRATPADSFVVMASDGLWDVIQDEEAVTIVKEKMAATAARGSSKAVLDARTKEASQLLLDTALNKGSMDNITVLVLLFQWH